MNILIFTQTFPLHPKHPNAHFLYDFALGFAKLGHTVTVLVPYHPDLKPSQFKGIKVLPFRYVWPNSLHFVGYGRTLENNRSINWFIFPLTPLYMLSAALTLYMVVKKLKPDVINAHWIIPSGFIGALIAKLTGTPLVISLAGTDVYISRMNVVLKGMATLACWCAKTIVANSAQLLLDLNTRGSVVSYPVQPIMERRKPNGRLVVAGAGRLVAHKGFHLLKEVEPGAEIISGLTIDQFRSKLLSVGIFVAPSMRDPSGNLDDANTVVLQAMAAGCAVVATDFPGYRAMITHGVNGMLFPEGKRAALAKIINTLKRSRALRQKLGRAARKTVLTQFTPQVIAKKYLALYEN